MPKPKFMSKRISAQDYLRMRNATCKTCRKSYYASRKHCPFCPAPEVKADDTAKTKE